MCKRCRKAEPVAGSWYCEPCRVAAKAQVERIKAIDAVRVQQGRKRCAGEPRVGAGTTFRYMRARCRPKDCEGGARVAKALYLGRIHILAAD